MLDGNEHPLGKSMQFLLWQISRQYAARCYRQITEQGLQPTQMPFLIMLHRHDGCSQKEMAEWLHIKPPTVNVSIQRLEKTGIVERKRDETDQRIARIYITEKGKTIMKKILEEAKETEKLMFGNFSEAELCLLRRFFEQILKNTEEMQETFPGGCGFLMQEKKQDKESNSRKGLEI